MCRSITASRAASPIRFRSAASPHSIRAYELPNQFENIDALTPFGAIYRYEDYDAAVPLDRHAARQSLRELRAWVEAQLLVRADQ